MDMDLNQILSISIFILNIYEYNRTLSISIFILNGYEYKLNIKHIHIFNLFQILIGQNHHKEVNPLKG